MARIPAQLDAQLKGVLSSLSLDNTKHVIVSGKTSGTANTKAEFRHALGGQPTMAIILEGNAYVQYNGIGPDTVDIRSTATSQQFRAAVIR